MNQTVKRTIDILIKGGLIFDGAGSEPFEADIGISGDAIAFIDKKKKPCHARKVIEAEGLAVAPGFIDTHAHSEFTLLADPRAEGKICQGITTEINGNCGLSAAPLFGKALKQREADLRELGIGERWATFREYFEILEGRGISLNFATLAGHGNIRACVAGYDDRKLTAPDIRDACALLRKSIAEGAIGFSTGLIYPPGVYSDTEELIDLAKCCNRHIYTSHMRSEGDRLIQSVEETLRIAKGAGIKVHISHVKTSGERNWYKINNVIQLIKEAQEEGTNITCDRYPYTAASTDLDTVLPNWAYEGGSEEELRRLREPVLQEKLRKQVLSEYPEMKYWERITISSVVSEQYRWMEGKNMASIAQREKAEPVDILFKVLTGEKLRVGAIFSSMNEENLLRFLSLPNIMIGTDSSARSSDGPTCKGKPHPRGFGTFPRFLGKYVRDNSLMDMSKAVHKITMLPARTFGIKKRGVLRKGVFADIVVFDHKKIIDRATFDAPFLKPEGIHYVIVNGLPAVWESEMTRNRSGRMLRHGK